MFLDIPVDSGLLASLATGLAAGAVLGGWWGRRTLSLVPTEVDYQSRLETLARAQKASEQANSELKQALDQMQEAAGTDRLTGAWNRRRFEDGVIQHMALAKRRGDPLSLFIFDLDHFKRVNDTFGHGVGDAVLKSVCSTVRDQLRVSDALVRWGGEEFIVLCPATTLAGATILADKIRRTVEAQAMPQVGMLTISLGVAQRMAGEDLDVWLARADGALYRSKERGRNRTEASLEMVESHGDEAPSILALVWDPALESGNAEIDHQHQVLYQLSNNLLASITSGRYPEDAKLQMQLLLAHVAQHFHDEEAILARAGFPDLESHAKEHRRLITKAKSLQQEIGGAAADLPFLLSFLALDLVKGHLLGWDRRFFKFLGSH